MNMHCTCVDVLFKTLQIDATQPICTTNFIATFVRTSVWSTLAYCSYFGYCSFMTHWHPANIIPLYLLNLQQNKHKSTYTTGSWEQEAQLPRESCRD